MKPSIPRSNSEYRLVNPDELPLISLSDQEKKMIDSFRRDINGTSTIAGYFAFIMGILFLLLFVYSYQTGQYDTESSLALTLGALLFWFVGGLSLRSRIPKDWQCTHGQYGIANGKWPGHNSSGGSGQNYFLDIIFPDTRTRCKQTICCSKDYKRVEKGQKVLVFVFDGRRRPRVYGILLD